MSNYLNLEKPKETDLNWGDAVNRNTDKIDAECSRLNTSLGTKANTNHTHNFSNQFAPLSHAHPELATSGHTHTGFATSGHTHSEITALQNRMTLAEARINTLFSDKADKSYVLNLLQNFDHSVANLTPTISLTGQGSNKSSLKVNCFINSPVFLLEWQVSYQWGNSIISALKGPQNTNEFSISKPGSNTSFWNGSNVTSVTLRVKCRNPFLNNNWSNEAVLTDNEIFMYNFIDSDKIIAALVTSSSFQTTVASCIIGNPGLSDRILSSVKSQSQTQSNAT